MASNRAQKLSELEVATSIANTDVFYLVSNGGSYQVSAQTVAEYILSLINPA